MPSLQHGLLVLALALPAAAPAQASPPDDAAPPFVVAGAFFALSVDDLDAATRWYEEKLGLRVVMRAPRSDATRSAATVLQGGGLTVELVRHDDAAPLVTRRGGGALYAHGIFKVGLVVEDFDRTLAALRARGVEIAIGPFPKRADQPANVIIRDGVGNMIQILGK